MKRQVIESIENPCENCNGDGIIWKLRCKECGDVQTVECPVCKGTGGQETVRDITKQYESLRFVAGMMLFYPNDDKVRAALQEALR
jgi:excinuclease UvrABC ATPase subunit